MVFALRLRTRICLVVLRRLLSMRPVARLSARMMVRRPRRRFVIGTRSCRLLSVVARSLTLMIIVILWILILLRLILLRSILRRRRFRRWKRCVSVVIVLSLSGVRATRRRVILLMLMFLIRPRKLLRLALRSLAFVSGGRVSPFVKLMLRARFLKSR